ncbi:MAG: hypothetical protein WDO13_06735 [Verrucomicrobiota bacterium]
MPAIFGDHMVLQRDAKIPVWGWADAGESVQVMLGSATVATTAGADGAWRVELPPQAANGGAATTLTVKGKNTLTFQDVLIGEVWIGSGQSNMGLSVLEARDGVQEAAKAGDPQLRLFQVTRRVAPTPLPDIVPTTPDRPFLGSWQVCTPDTPAQHSVVGNFSAVAFYFGRELRRATGQPVGMIATSWGGTPGQAWTSLEGLQSAPALNHYVLDAQRFATNYPAAHQAFVGQQAAYAAAKQKWGRRSRRAVQGGSGAVAGGREPGEGPRASRCRPNPRSPRPSRRSRSRRMRRPASRPACSTAWSRR